MDKWDELTQRIQKSILADEPESAVSASFQLLCEFGRTLEQISADLDRIATAVEGRQVEVTRDDEESHPVLDL